MWVTDLFSRSPNIFIRGRGREGKRIAVRYITLYLTYCMFSVLLVNIPTVAYVWARCVSEKGFTRLRPCRLVMASNNAAPSEGIVSSLQTFVGEHKKLIIGAAAVVTAVAVVYYTTGSTSTVPAEDLEQGEHKKSKKKKTKTSKGGNPAPQPNGAILEELPKEDRPTCKSLRLPRITLY
jgi:hypothetical protein